MMPDGKRRIVEQMVRAIVVGDGTIDFHLVQLLSYQEITNRQNMYHAALPFCHFTLRVGSERITEFSLTGLGLVRSPKTLGEHLRNRRLRLGLRQKDAAARLGTMREVYERWERDVREPVISEWPSVLSFLGRYPFSIHASDDLVLGARRCLGADQKRLAKMLGVIHQRLRRWEHGTERIPANVERRLRALTNFDPSLSSAPSC